MTKREKEIRDSERKIFADLRKARRLIRKEEAAMTPEEYAEHRKKLHKEIRAMGIKLVSSLK
jgi:hypothetical protein